MKSSALCRTRSLRPGQRRRGYTLVEMLVTTVVITIVLLALVNVFAWVGDRVATGRAVIEMSNGLRSASQRLQADLDGLTVAVRPWPSPDSAQGYFEYIERPENDDTGRNLTPAVSMQGDRDDILAFTSRTSNEPFTGQWLGNSTNASGQVVGAASPLVIASPEAEVVWWAQSDDVDSDFTFAPDEQVSLVLHRRVLTIRPDVNNAAGFFCDLPTYLHPNQASYNIPSDLSLLRDDMRAFQNSTDISVRYVRNVSGSNLTVRVIANSLADLSQRENRWMRHPMVLMNPSLAIAPAPTFPYPIDLNINSATSLGFSPHWGNRLGEDVILSNLQAFDVRAFDPTVRVVGVTGGSALLPGDPGWTPALASVNGNVIGFGGYVDLNYSFPFVTAKTWVNTCNSQFSGLILLNPMGVQLNPGGVTLKSQLSGLGYSVYDTWSYYYEQDGVDQDNDGTVDQGSDGLDTDGQNGTDDPAERETAPPFPVPLRGIQAVIRVVDPDSRQIRQATVASNFLPD